MKNKSCCGKCKCVKSPGETDEMVEAREVARKLDEKRRKREDERMRQNNDMWRYLRTCSM